MAGAEEHKQLPHWNEMPFSACIGDFCYSEEWGYANVASCSVTAEYGGDVTDRTIEIGHGETTSSKSVDTIVTTFSQNGEHPSGYTVKIRLEDNGVGLVVGDGFELIESADGYYPRAYICTRHFGTADSLKDFFNGVIYVCDVTDTEWFTPSRVSFGLRLVGDELYFEGKGRCKIIGKEYNGSEDGYVNPETSYVRVKIFSDGTQTDVTLASLSDPQLARTLSELPGNENWALLKK